MRGPLARLSRCAFASPECVPRGLAAAKNGRICKAACHGTRARFIRRLGIHDSKIPTNRRMTASAAVARAAKVKAVLAACWSAPDARSAPIIATQAAIRLTRDQRSHMAKVIGGRGDRTIGSLRTASSRARFSLRKSCSVLPRTQLPSCCASLLLYSRRRYSG